jgi:hypothetical protein
MAFEQAAKFVVEELVIRDNGAITFPDDTQQTTAFVGDTTPLPKYGVVTKMDSGTITIETQDEYQSTGVTGVLDALNDGVSVGTTDTFAIKNTSGATRIFDITGSIDVTAGATAVVVGIKLAKNGTPIAASECRAHSPSNLTAKLVNGFIVSLAPNDEVSLVVANFTDTTSLTFLRGRIIARTV